MKAWRKERQNIGDKYMKVHNLGKEIDNLHKNIVNVEHKRGIKTCARDDIGSILVENNFYGSILVVYKISSILTTNRNIIQNM